MRNCEAVWGSGCRCRRVPGELGPESGRVLVYNGKPEPVPVDYVETDQGKRVVWVYSPEGSLPDDLVAMIVSCCLDYPFGMEGERGLGRHLGPSPSGIHGRMENRCVAVSNNPQHKIPNCSCA